MQNYSVFASSNIDIRKKRKEIIVAKKYKKTTYIASGSNGNRRVEEILVRKRKHNKIRRILIFLLKVGLLLLSIFSFISWIYNKPKSKLNEKYQDEFVIEKITSFNIIEKDKKKWNKEDWKSYFHVYWNFIAKQKYSDNAKFKGTYYLEDDKVNDYYVEILLEDNINEILNRNINKFDEDSIIYGEAIYEYCLSPNEAIIVNFASKPRRRYNINIYYNQEVVIPNAIYKEIDNHLFEGLESLSGTVNLYIVDQKTDLNMRNHHQSRHSMCNDCHALFMSCPSVSFKYNKGKIKTNRIKFATELISSLAEKLEIDSNVQIVVK